MPETAGSPRDLMAQTMADGKKVLIPHLAEMLRREGIEEVDSSEERRRYWQRAMSDEQEQMLWQQEMMARGITELTPEQAVEIGLGIAKQVYPDRFDMLAADGRDTQAAQAEWAASHARKGPPQPKQTDVPVEGAA